MSTLRIHGIEAKSDPTSASVNEKIKITNSSGELLFHLDGTQSGIGTVGITTTGTTFHVDRATGEITFVTDAKFNGTVGIAGTLTYEDVSNIDSVGIITARQGIKVTADGTSSSNYISAGASDDLKLYHTTGGNSHIKETGGGALVINADDFYLQNNATTTFLRTHSSGAIDLNFGGNKKFETTNSGAIVTGICTATSFVGSGANLTNLPASAPVGGASTNTVFFENDNSVDVNYSVTSGKNAMSAGPVQIKSGITVTVPSGSFWTIV